MDLNKMAIFCFHDDILRGLKAKMQEIFPFGVFQHPERHVCTQIMANSGPMRYILILQINYFVMQPLFATISIAPSESEPPRQSPPACLGPENQNQFLIEIEPCRDHNFKYGPSL